MSDVADGLKPRHVAREASDHNALRTRLHRRKQTIEERRLRRRTTLERCIRRITDNRPYTTIANALKELRLNRFTYHWRRIYFPVSCVQHTPRRGVD